MNENSTINEMLISILSDFQVPVRYGWYEGEKQTNITFFEYLMQGADYQDDEMVSCTHNIQVDIWGYTNIEQLKNQVIKALLKNNFLLVDCKDLFEEDIKLYHKAIRVRINKVF